MIIVAIQGPLGSYLSMYVNLAMSYGVIWTMRGSSDSDSHGGSGDKNQTPRPHFRKSTLSCFIAARLLF